MVPNAVLVDSPTLQNQTQYFLDFVIQNQAADGWLGPEVFDSTKPRYLWARYILRRFLRTFDLHAGSRLSTDTRICLEPFK